MVIGDDINDTTAPENDKSDQESVATHEKDTASNEKRTANEDLNGSQKKRGNILGEVNVGVKYRIISRKNEKQYNNVIIRQKGNQI